MLRYVECSRCQEQQQQLSKPAMTQPKMGDAVHDQEQCHDQLVCCNSTGNMHIAFCIAFSAALGRVGQRAQKRQS